MNVKIYKPSKSAMQSGRSGAKAWVLEYETHSPRQAEPLMGWTESSDTLNQVRLNFSSSEDAISFAKEKGWDYDVLPDHHRRLKPRNYGDNFKYVPPQEQS